MIDPIRNCINEPGRRYIPLPGGWALMTRGEAGVLELKRFHDVAQFSVEVPVAIDAAAADVLERMATDIHADLAERFEAVRTIIDRLGDKRVFSTHAWCRLELVVQALTLFDEPTAALAGLDDVAGRR